MIYRCRPENVERIWGSLPGPVGEIWWFHGGTQLTGPDGGIRPASGFFPRDGFPVILKTLHAARDLSVQVHPGKDRRAPVKDESWAILEGTGRILHGVRDGVAPGDFESAVRDGTVESVLETFEAAPGDLFHLPAGTVHALGGGLTVLEIQLSCTITYRLWDYGRTDPEGKTRELHIEEGLESVDWTRNGRALRVTGNIEAEGYSMKRVPPGTVRLRENELAYDHGGPACLFAGPGGGTCETSGETWIVRIV